MITVFNEIETELNSAKEKYPNSHRSFHESYAILKEEVDELWEEIKRSKNDNNKHEVRKEALQVAAMAIRFITDTIDKK